MRGRTPVSARHVGSLPLSLAVVGSLLVACSSAASTSGFGVAGAGAFRFGSGFRSGCFVAASGGVGFGTGSGFSTGFGFASSAAAVSFAPRGLLLRRRRRLPRPALLSLTSRWRRCGISPTSPRGG